jgi:hypothetical protein
MSVRSLLACLALGSLASTGAEPAPAEAARVWTPTATGKGNKGVLLSKTPDNSTVVIRMETGREVTVKTGDLIPADRDYVAKWSGPATESQGIVRGRMGGVLSQSSGGKSRVMKDLQSVLADYGKPENDAKPHPDALIYRGSAFFPGGGPVSIPYLMPRVKALALLVQRPGLASPRPALAPGFPPGMINYEYDIRFGVFNRLFVIVDQADQVVALQIKAENGNDPTIPLEPTWKQAAMPMGSTSDFIEPKTGLAAAHVLDLRAKEKRIVVDLEYPPPPYTKMETLLFLPEPMIRLCLFHIALDLRN